jgi:hypothetical protein
MVGKIPIWVKKDQYFIKESRFNSGSTILYVFEDYQYLG